MGYPTLNDEQSITVSGIWAWKCQAEHPTTKSRARLYGCEAQQVLYHRQSLSMKAAIILGVNYVFIRIENMQNNLHIIYFTVNQ